jgi:hypothetical protein
MFALQRPQPTVGAQGGEIQQCMMNRGMICIVCSWIIQRCIILQL